MTKQEAFPLAETAWPRMEYRDGPDCPDSRRRAPALPTRSPDLTGRASEAPSAEEQRSICPPLPDVEVVGVLGQEGLRGWKISLTSWPLT